LCKDSIGICAEKGFDPEILLDPFEEQFDFPSLLVHFSDGSGFEIKGIGEDLALCIWGNPNIRTPKYQRSNDGSAASSLTELSTALPIVEQQLH